MYYGLMGAGTYFIIHFILMYFIKHTVSLWCNNILVILLLHVYNTPHVTSNWMSQYFTVMPIGLQTFLNDQKVRIKYYYKV